MPNEEFLERLDGLTTSASCFLEDLERETERFFSKFSSIKEVNSVLKESLYQLRGISHTLEEGILSLKRFAKHIDTLRVLSFVEAERVAGQNTSSYIKPLVGAMDGVCNDLFKLSSDATDLLEDAKKHLELFFNASSEVARVIEEFEDKVMGEIVERVKNRILPGVKESIKGLRELKERMGLLREESVKASEELKEEMDRYISFVEGRYNAFLRKIPPDVFESEEFREGESSVEIGSHIHREGDVELF